MSGAARRAELVAVLTAPEDLDAGQLNSLDVTADALEVRADLLGDPDPHRLRRHFAGALTYCLRTRRQGGCHHGRSAERRTRLLRAADRYDVVDLEWPHDLTPDVLAAVPPGKRRISWHGPRSDRDGLRELFAAMSAVPAALYLLAPAGCASSPPLLLSDLARSDVTAFLPGPAGVWTRILAPWLGAPVVFGTAGSAPADGMPSVRQLVLDYGLPALPELHGLYGIAGATLDHSLSPRLHNSALRELGLPALYLPFPTDSLPRLLRTTASLGALAGLPLRGLTVTAPHKEDALALADVASPAARGAGAANVLWAEDGRWRADTTDTTGVLDALAMAGIDPAGRSTAVIGCGGAGRAAALALRQARARVTLVNRGPASGRQAAERLGLPFVPLSRFCARGFSLLVHATPLADRSPFPLAAADPRAAVLELVHRSGPTALMAAARARGLVAVDGREVLRVEVREQFRLLTGRRMPLGTGQMVLGAPGRRDICSGINP